MEREDIKMLVKKWWDIYNDESLDYKNIVVPANATTPTPVLPEPVPRVSLESFLAAISEAGVVPHVRAPSAA